MQLLRASYLLPISSPLIRDAAVLIDEEKDLILAVGSFEKIKQDPRTQNASLLSLEKTVLLPGFVNAHCHLELTALEGFSFEGTFTDWIRALVEKKSSLNEEDFNKSFEEGLQRLIQSGTTTVADHVSIGMDFSPLLQSKIRSQIILESLGVNPEVAQKLYELGIEAEVENVFLSPHSAHSLSFPILEKLLRSERKFFSIHLAESAEEDEFFKKGSGKLFEFIQSRTNVCHSSEGWNPEDINWIPAFAGMTQATSSLQYLEKHKLLSDRILAVHCNYVDDEDIALLQKNKMSVVHCPSSHKYFEHQPFPLEKLKAARINIALGTDSLSSGVSLSLLDQVRIAQKNYPDISSQDWLRTLTINGARALKMENEIGTIEEGKKADIIGFKMTNFSGPEEDLAKLILKKEKVDFMMCRGEILSTD